MKYRFALACAVVISVSFLLGAQAKPVPKVDFSDPASVARAFFAALEEGRYEDLSQLVQESARDEIEQLNPSIALAEALGMDVDAVDGFMDVYSISFKGLSLDKARISGLKATVHAKGTMLMALDMGIMRRIIEYSFGELADDSAAEIDMMMDAIAATAEHESEIDDDIGLVKTQGKWLIAEGF